MYGQIIVGPRFLAEVSRKLGNLQSKFRSNNDFTKQANSIGIVRLQVRVHVLVWSHFHLHNQYPYQYTTLLKNVSVSYSHTSFFGADCTISYVHICIIQFRGKYLIEQNEDANENCVRFVCYSIHLR